MAFTELKPENVEFLAIHCSATPAKMDIGVKEITRWHRQKLFLTIGYHYVIRRDGTLEKGRSDNVIGAHVEGYNHCSIGICLVGGLTPSGQPENNFTDDQMHALALLLIELRKKFPKAVIQGHRDFPNVKKDCPCFDARQWVKETMDAPQVG